MGKKLKVHDGSDSDGQHKDGWYSHETRWNQDKGWVEWGNGDAEWSNGKAKWWRESKDEDWKEWWSNGHAASEWKDEDEEWKKWWSNGHAASEWTDEEWKKWRSNGSNGHATRQSKDGECKKSKKLNDPKAQKEEFEDVVVEAEPLPKKKPLPTDVLAPGPKLRVDPWSKRRAAPRVVPPPPRATTCKSKIPVARAVGPQRPYGPPPQRLLPLCHELHKVYVSLYSLIAKGNLESPEGFGEKSNLEDVAGFHSLIEFLWKKHRESAGVISPDTLELDHETKLEVMLQWQNLLSKAKQAPPSLNT